MARHEISSITPTGKDQRIDENFTEVYVSVGDLEISVADLAATIDAAGDDLAALGTAWVTASATVTAESGSYTSATGTMRYKQIGKTIHVRLQATITTVGSGTGVMKIQVPVAANGLQALVPYIENPVDMGVLRCFIPNGIATATIQLLDATTGSQIDTAQNTTIVIVSGTYESI